MLFDEQVKVRWLLEVAVGAVCCVLGWNTTGSYPHSVPVLLWSDNRAQVRDAKGFELLGAVGSTFHYPGAL